MAPFSPNTPFSSFPSTAAISRRVQFAFPHPTRSSRMPPPFASPPPPRKRPPTAFSSQRRRSSSRGPSTSPSAWRLAEMRPFSARAWWWWATPALARRHSSSTSRLRWRSRPVASTNRPCLCPLHPLPFQIPLRPLKRTRSCGGVVSWTEIWAYSASTTWTKPPSQKSGLLRRCSALASSTFSTSASPAGSSWLWQCPPCPRFPPSSERMVEIPPFSDIDFFNHTLVLRSPTEEERAVVLVGKKQQ